METANKYITDDITELDPSNQDLFLSIPSGEYQRLIFGEPLELREREEVAWESFMAFIKE